MSQNMAADLAGALDNMWPCNMLNAACADGALVKGLANQVVKMKDACVAMPGAMMQKASLATPSAPAVAPSAAAEKAHGLEQEIARPAGPSIKDQVSAIENGGKDHDALNQAMEQFRGTGIVCTDMSPAADQQFALATYGMNQQQQQQEVGGRGA